MRNHQNLSVNDWKEKRENGNFELLDVRTPGEFSDSYIKGAVNIDIMQPDFPSKIEALDKNKSYLVYCRSGQRSLNAMNFMKEHGFKEVHNLEGGIMAWERSGNDVEYGMDF